MRRQDTQFRPYEQDDGSRNRQGRQYGGGDPGRREGMRGGEQGQPVPRSRNEGEYDSLANRGGVGNDYDDRDSIATDQGGFAGRESGFGPYGYGAGYGSGANRSGMFGESANDEWGGRPGYPGGRDGGDFGGMRGTGAGGSFGQSSQYGSASTGYGAARNRGSGQSETGYGADFGGPRGAQGNFGDRGQRSGVGTYGGYAGQGRPGQGSYPGGLGGSSQGGYGQSGYGGSQSFGEGGYGLGGDSHAGSAGRASTGPRRNGPKGYQRSDDRIRDDVCERLYHSTDLDVENVSVEVHEGKVTLEGTVPQRHMKHRIEDLIDELHGVRDIDNRVRVSRGGDIVGGGMDAGSIAHGAQSGGGLSGSTTASSTDADGSQSGSGRGTATGSGTAGNRPKKDG